MVWEQDIIYMSRALELAAKGRFTTTPNPNVGCVIVLNDNIVGEGYHYKSGEPHAEVYALRMAGKKAKDATAYVTLEPCSHFGKTPPCADALIQAGIKRVVIAMEDPNPQVAGKGIARLQAAGIEICCGVLSTQAEELNKGFLKRMRHGIPYVQLKIAASLDGRTAMASGESKWITSPQARQDVQAFRAQSGAILSTGSTVLADNPALNVRWQELPPTIKLHYPVEHLRQPLRVIIDSQNRMTPDLNVMRETGETLLVSQQHYSYSLPQHVKHLLLPNENRYIDLSQLMRSLADKAINSVWVEAGANLAGALLTNKLVDELIIYIAPKLLGDQARGLCHLPHLSQLADALQFSISDIQQIGPDVRLRLLPVNEI